LKINNKNIREMAYIKAPNMSIWEHDAFGNLTGEYFNPINSYQGSGVTYFNPVAVADLSKNNAVTNDLKNTFMLQFRLNSWLVFRETVSFQYSGSKQKSFLPYNAIGADWTDWNINKAGESNYLGNSIRTETQFSFSSPFKSKDHQLSGVASWITDQSKQEGIFTESNRSGSINLTDPAVSAQVGWMANGSDEKRMISGVGNLNYKFKDRYMLTFNTRADASSVFGRNKRMGVFAGVAGAWRFSDESFLDQFDWLDDSKIRGSWGIVGRQPDDTYARFSDYVTTKNGAYINHTAIAPSKMELSNLSWENTATTNIGLDIILFKGRVNFTAEIYDKITTNILFKDYVLPGISGYDKLKFYNGGELTNRGWEIMFDTRIIQKKDFSLAINFNTNRNRNAFSKLPPNFNPEKSTTIGNGQYPLLVEEGKPIGSFYGFRYLGVFPTDKDAVARDADDKIMYHSNGSPIPLRYLNSYTFKGGDPHYKDLNNDGKIDLNDVEKIGDSNPDFIGGFGTNIKYKDFSFSASFQYRIGFDIINGIALQTEGMNNRNNQSKAVLNRWRLQGHDEPGLLPRAYMNHPANNLGSDRYVERGDFLRLNDIKISYKLKQQLCSKLGIRQGSFTLSGRKLLTITNYTGQDPEVGQDASNPFWIGEDKAQTPPPRVFTLTLGVGL
jgi:TonB-linked SusC/RagA family outer membrane protein